MQAAAESSEKFGQLSFLRKNWTLTFEETRLATFAEYSADLSGVVHESGVLFEVKCKLAVI